MAPRYFVFSRAEDDFGNASWEGLASVRAEDCPAVRQELDALLAALSQRAPGSRGPLDEGGTWDWQLDEAGEAGWWNFSLTVVGPADWADDLLD